VTSFKQRPATTVGSGCHWIVAATNLLVVDGQLRRSTDRRNRHRRAALGLATAILIVGRLNWRNRWQP